MAAPGEGGTKVVCRVRPRTLAEQSHKSCVHVRGCKVRVNDASSSSSSPAPAATASSFAGTFDDVFGSSSTNGQVFASLLPTLEDVQKGYNGAILAYGQSGAGKTHTMNGCAGSGEGNSELGIIPRVRVFSFSNTTNDSNTQLAEKRPRCFFSARLSPSLSSISRSAAPYSPSSAAARNVHVLLSVDTTHPHAHSWHKK
jgi:chromosomal replication initiation ATPase DnaA